MSFFAKSAVLGLLTLAACQSPDLVEREAIAPDAKARQAAAEADRYVVLLKDSPVLDQLFRDDNTDYDGRQVIMRNFLQNAIGADLAQRAQLLYTHAVRGFAVPLSAQEVLQLRASPLIQSVSADGVVALDEPGRQAGGPAPTVSLPTQVVPWGIDRVGGFQNFITPSRRAWILDTGIDYEHPDLNVDIPLSRSFMSYTTSATDDNFHGTHVSGTVAAKNNGFGVVGVAAGAKVVAVKVLGANGSGSWAGVLAGVDYVSTRAGAGDVANLSLGGFGTQPELSAAIRKAALKGIRFVLAAGNSAMNANLFAPGNTNGWNIFTVSATDINDRFASFSNYGNPPIDFAAPGVRVLSTDPLFWGEGGYFVLSGTSMAAPHVAGILLLNGGQCYKDGTAIGDPDGNPDPIASRVWRSH